MRIRDWSSDVCSSSSALSKQDLWAPEHAMRACAPTDLVVSGVLGEVLEGGGLVVLGLLGEAEHALADDVALDLIGAAVAGPALADQRHAGDHRPERVAGCVAQPLLVLRLVG